MSDRDFSQWERALRAYAPVQTKGTSLRGYCPNCGHGPRVLKVEERNNRVLVYCFRGCSFRQIVSCLFGDGTGSAPEKKAKLLIDIEIPSGSRIVPGSVQRYPRKYRDGRECVTVAIGRNFDGNKVPWYEHPDGRPSHKLDDLDVHDLPFFNTELVDQYPAAAIILCEGEKSARALTTILPPERFIALGTGSAGVMPNRLVLEVLFGREVFCWADNDPYNERLGKWVGQQHMADIADWLEMEGEPRPRFINPDLLGPKGDAADFVAEGGTFARLEQMLLAHTPPPTPPTWRDGTILPGNAPSTESDDVIRARIVVGSVWDGGLATQDIGKGALLTPLDAETAAIPGRPIIFFPRRREKNNRLNLPAGTLVRMSQYGRPGLRQWIIPPFLPWGAAATIYADAGMFKTFLVIGLCLSVSMGLPFCGYQVETPGAVIFVDAELDSDEFARRAHRILSGMGFSDHNLPDTLTYMNTRGMLLKDLDSEIRAAIKQEDPVLVAIDSWQFATGIEPKDVQGTVEYYNRFKTYGDGSVLVIDHTRAPVGKDAANRPYGNNFKYAATRSALYLSRPNPGALVLSQRKNTFSPETDLFIEMKLDGIAGPVTFTPGDPNDIKFQPPQDEEGDADERVLGILGETSPMDAPTLARKVGLSESYVRAILGRQKKANRVKPNGRGSWTVVKQAEDAGATN